MMDASDETIRLPVPTAEKIFVNILLIPNLYGYFDSIHWLVFAFHVVSVFFFFPEERDRRRGSKNWGREWIKCHLGLF